MFRLSTYWLVICLIVTLRYTTRMTRVLSLAVEHELDDHFVLNVVTVHVKFVFEFLAHAEKSDLRGFRNASRLLLL